MFIKYCVFSLKCCDFSELYKFWRSVGACPAIVYTHLTPRGNRERPESGIYLRNNTIFNEHPVLLWDLHVSQVFPGAGGHTARAALLQKTSYTWPTGMHTLWTTWNSFPSLTSLSHESSLLLTDAIVILQNNQICLKWEINYSKVHYNQITVLEIQCVSVYAG